MCICKIYEKEFRIAKVTKMEMSKIPGRKEVHRGELDFPLHVLLQEFGNS